MFSHRFVVAMFHHLSGCQATYVFCQQRRFSLVGLLFVPWMNLFHFTCSRWFCLAQKCVPGVDRCICWAAVIRASQRCFMAFLGMPLCGTVPTDPLALSWHCSGFCRCVAVETACWKTMTCGKWWKWYRHGKIAAGLMTHVHFKEVTRVYQQALDVKKKGFLRELESKDFSVPTVNKNNEQMFVQKRFVRTLWSAAFLHGRREF